MVVHKKLSVMFTALLLLAVTVSPAFAESPALVSMTIEGVTSQVPLDSMSGSTSGTASFGKLEDIANLYVCVNPESKNTSTLSGYYLLLSPPFYLDGNHELNALYGTFTRDMTNPNSRTEYTRVYYGVWQWVYDSQDPNKVMVRLGKDEYTWRNLWMWPMYFVYSRDTVHINTKVIAHTKQADLIGSDITLQGHTFVTTWQKFNASSQR